MNQNKKTQHSEKKFLYLYMNVNIMKIIIWRHSWDKHVNYVIDSFSGTKI